MFNKEQKTLLKIIRKFFNKEKINISLKKNKVSKLDCYIKETCMDGIAYLVLKKELNIPKYYIKDLKERFEILKESYNDLNEAFDRLKQLPFKKILIKENIFKYTEKNYIKGVRYSCDIDFFVPDEKIFNVYQSLNQNSFYSNALDFDRDEKIKKLGFRVNKDITKYINLRERDKSVIEKLLYKKENYKPVNPLKKLRKNLEEQINDLNNIVNLYKKIETENFYINKEIKEIINNLSQKTKDTIELNKENELINKKYLLSAENKLLEILQQEKNYNLSSIITTLEKTLSRLKNNINNNDQSAVCTKELTAYSQNLLSFFNEYINKTIKLRKIIDKERKIHAFYKNGAFIDLHFNKNLFYKNKLVKININNLEKTKISDNLYILNYEDSIIMDACHFTFNLKKYKDPYAFQGFLKYTTDLLHKMKFKKIDWNKVIIIAQKTQSSSQVWFYLKIAKKYLNADIKESILNKLKKDGYKGQNILLSLIPEKSLLFNNSNIFVKIYSKAYLENSFFNKLIDRLHRIYNHFNS